jgi:hypothetical protein
MLTNKKFATEMHAYEFINNANIFIALDVDWLYIDDENDIITVSSHADIKGIKYSLKNNPKLMVYMHREHAKFCQNCRCLLEDNYKNTPICECE